MTSRLIAWLRLSQAPEGSREKAVSLIIQREGLSGVAERCGVSVRDVETWVLLKQVPESFAECLDTTESPVHPVDSLVPKYVELRETGMTMQAIADELGVTKQAVSKGLKAVN